MASIFLVMKRDQKQWILFLAGALVFSICFSFFPKVGSGIFYYILSILRDLPLFIFGLFVYLITQVPFKNQKMIWGFWVILAIILSCMETFSFQTMFAWYFTADMENPYLLLGLSCGLSLFYGVIVWAALFPCLFSLKRNSTIGDGYLQCFLHKRIMVKGILYILLLEVLYNIIFWGIAEFLSFPPIVMNGIFKVFYLLHFVAMGFILYWMNEKIALETK